MTNQLFYTKHGKFYISRQVVEAAFIHFVGSLQPDKWDEGILKARFEVLLNTRKRENDGVFAKCFAQAERINVSNWIFTDILIEDVPAVDTRPNATVKVLIKSSDQKNVELEEIDDTQLAGMEQTDLEDYDINTKDDISARITNRMNRANSSRAGKTTVDKNTALNQRKYIDERILRPKFEFADFDIPIGATLTLFNNPQETVEVTDEFFGVRYTGPRDLPDLLFFTPLTRVVMGKKRTTNLSPMDYWCFEGKRLRQLYNEKYGDRKRQMYRRTKKEQEFDEESVIEELQDDDQECDTNKEESDVFESISESEVTEFEIEECDGNSFESISESETVIP